jgi:anti-sigma regulatory factor (Ser/Thr protein kinase)
MSGEQQLELTLPPAPASVAEARARVLDAVGQALADDDRATLQLLVSEVVTNAIRHAGCEEPLELHARWDDEVRIEVVNRGGGFIPRPRAGGLEDPGGFGLYLVSRLADRWGVEADDTTCVWFVIGGAGRAGSRRRARVPRRTCPARSRAGR